MPNRTHLGRRERKTFRRGGKDSINKRVRDAKLYICRPVCIPERELLFMQTCREPGKNGVDGMHMHHSAVGTFGKTKKMRQENTELTYFSVSALLPQRIKEHIPRKSARTPLLLAYQ